MRCLPTCAVVMKIDAGDPPRYSVTTVKSPIMPPSM